MANIATLSLINGKWTAMFQGQVISSSGSKEYVVGYIKSGQCARANKAKVVDAREVGEFIVTADGETEKIETSADKFGINDRFAFLEDFVKMVADKTSPSLVVTGEGGLGKTFVVNKTLRDSGLTNMQDLLSFEETENEEGEESKPAAFSRRQNEKQYTVVKGYSTAKGLFRTLYENRHRVIVFDDCDSVLENTTAVNLLKAALDSYDRRIISWNAESFGDDDLPRSFEFTGGVIFISNRPIFKIDQAIRSRAICVDLSMTSAQKIERMGVIIKTEEFMPQYEMEVKESALKFLDKMQNRATDLNLRTLISVTRVAARGGEWENRAEYLLTSSN